MKKLIIDGTEIEVVRYKWYSVTAEFHFCQDNKYGVWVEVTFDFDSLKKFLPILYAKNNYFISDEKHKDLFRLPTYEIEKIRQFLSGKNRKRVSLTFEESPNKFEGEKTKNETLDKKPRA